MTHRITDEALLGTLTRLFREHGYAGTTLTRISEATGLGRASLYHRFPEGKAGMVEEVLERVDEWLQADVISVLASDEPPPERLAEMRRSVVDFYEGGQQACVFETLSLDDPTSPIAERLKQGMLSWIRAVETTLVEAGLPGDLAGQRANQLMICIQGSLVVSRVLDDPTVFEMVARGLADQALAGFGSDFGSGAEEGSK